MSACAQRILATGCKYVLITGSHANTPQVVNTLYGSRGVLRADAWERLQGSYHGSGCTLASALAGALAHGLDVSQAVFEAEAGFDTYDSCVRARKVFGATRVIVVSQRYHLPRALTICRAIGLDAWGVGDESVKTNQQMWLYGSMRELGANLKMAWDVLSQRQPTLGPRETGVDDALRA